MPVLLGTSGWQYRHWRERFYPKGTPQRAWLEFYAERFITVESNAAFYRLPERKTFESWARRTPDEFVWAVKVSRYLTHIRRLKEPHEPVARFLDRAEGLGRKLGPVLLQLPPTLQADLGLLRDTLDEFRSRVRLAVEFRHETWFTKDVRSLLEERDAALCLADRGSRPVTPLWRTTDWGYVRFHGGTGRPETCYGRTALGTWARRLADLHRRDEDVFVYFNNDPHGCALRDVRVFRGACERAGLRPTGVPADAIPVG
jgi:uncharacterized protein YecE (DUF72 family)